jgi:hypothetical protein
MPADGGPLTSEDGRAARTRLASAGGEIGAFLNLRRNGVPQTTVVAEARPPVAPPRAAAQSAWEAHTVSAPKPPTLAEQPRIVASGPAPVSPPAPKDRVKLHELAALASLAPEPRLLSAPKPAVRPPSIASLAEEALEGRQAAGGGHQVAAIDAAAWTPPQDAPGPTGRFGWGATGQDLRWVPATEFDDDHSDELNYRPFAIAPLLTENADEPLLAELIAHDAGRTLDMIDQPVSRLPLHFRPTEQVAAMMWSQQFTGNAVGLDRLNAPQPSAPTPVRQRAVQTSSR